MFVNLLNKKKYLILINLVFIVLYSCNNGSNEDPSREINGGKAKYGGVLTISEEENLKSLFPPIIVDAISAKIASQIHNGLVKFDARDLSILPCIAKDWNIDDSQTEYTFYLRNNVFFHDDTCFEKGKGGKVTANDFKFTFELLCSPGYEISYSLIKDKIVGAEEFHVGQADNISGISVENDSTFKIKLKEPLSSFIYTLAMPNTSVISKEAYQAYGINMKVGAGPFVYTEPENELIELFLVYNENYFMNDKDGNQLPYLDTVHFIFTPTKLAELELFRTNKLSILHGLPPSKIAEVFAENKANFTNRPPKTFLRSDPELVTQFYEFNSQIAPFNDIRVRKAFNYAINKKKLISNTLNKQGAVGSKGITPDVPLFKKYDFGRIKGYEYDPELARELLAEAGYPNGKDFPNVRLELNLGGNTHLTVANEIQHQLNSVLNIWIEFEQVSFADKIEHSKYGKSEIFRSAWVADYPSPESFLSIFYGGGVPESMEEPAFPNTMRYRNDRFDSLFIHGIKNTNESERYELFAEAEKLMMEDAPVMILWYQENSTLYNSKIRNFYYNSMEHLDFCEVYIKTLSEEEMDELESEWNDSGKAKVK